MNTKALEAADVMELMQLRFTSDNEIPVERAYIRADEWAILSKHFPEPSVPVKVKELGELYPCSICAGTKELLTGQPCGCKDGTIHGELHFIRMCAFKAQQQRDAALKLADKWEQYAENFREQSKDWLASLPKNVDPPSYIHDECAADLRAIFAPKE